jgi:hypothetical protein
MLFSPPKEWQDWGSLLLGIWLCVSPWALRFAADSTATNTVLCVGFLMIAAEVLPCPHLASSKNLLMPSLVRGYSSPFGYLAFPHRQQELI